MKLIIDIDEEVYKEYMNLATGRIPTYKACDIAYVLRNGTPLPKGHGRLIDADSVNNIVLPIESSDCEWAVTGETVKKLIYAVFNKADTIIEADTERRKDAT